MVSKFYNEQVAKTNKKQIKFNFWFSPLQNWQTALCIHNSVYITIATCLISFFSNKQIKKSSIYSPL